MYDAYDDSKRSLVLAVVVVLQRKCVIHIVTVKISLLFSMV